MKSDIFILERRWNICRKLNVVKNIQKNFVKHLKEYTIMRIRKLVGDLYLDLR